MERLELEVNVRVVTGKGAARKLRARGSVPAVVYGGGTKTQSLEVKERLLAAVLRSGANQVIDLKGPQGFKNRLVLLKDYQRDPVSQALLHCDFYSVDTTQLIDVQVPVLIEGKAKGVELGGILEVVQREIHVRCLPLEIPESLSLDVSDLDVGDALHVSDLVAPEGSEIVTDAAQTVVHVVAPRVEEEPEAEDEVVEGEEGAAPADGDAPAEGEAPKSEEGSGD